MTFVNDKFSFSFFLQEVEEFLSKDIKIVITNQVTDKVASKKLVGNSPISNGPSPIQV